MNNQLGKRLIPTLLALLFFVTGCGSQPAEPFDTNTVVNYESIPGVTQEEIAAIESFKNEGRRFVYGHTASSEAFRQADGTYAGYAIELCHLMSTLLGITVTPQMYDEWDDLLDAFNQHTVDFVGEMTSTPERNQLYYMSKPVADRQQRLFTLTGSNEITTEADLRDKRIGFFAGTVNAMIIQSRYPEIGYIPVELSLFSEAAEKLASGEIDGFITDNSDEPAFWPYDFIQSQNILPLAYMPISITTANADLYPILSVIDKYIEAGGLNTLYALYHEGELTYARFKFQQSLTDEEKAYLEDLQINHRTVPVAIEPDNYPVSFYNYKEKDYQGFAVDVLQEISILTGIDFEPANQPVTTWAEMFYQVKDGEVPMIVLLLRTDSRKNDFLWADEPFSHSYYALLSKQEYHTLSNYQILHARVGILRQSAHTEIFDRIFPQHENTVIYDNWHAALDALEKGDIDLLMASEYTLLMQHNYREKSGYKVNYRFNGIPFDAYFGFHKDETILRSLISKAQIYVNTEDINTSWITRVFNYSKAITTMRNRSLVAALIILIIIMVVMATLLIRNRRLSRNLQQLAFTDHLTGILNRNHFMTMALTQIDRANRLGTESFIIIYDLDHFKNVNDTYGHPVGDKVLKGVTQRVKDTIRPYDLFGRYGGEEFILYIADTNKTTISHIAERIRKSIADQPIDCGEHQIPITASFGIARVSPAHDLEKATSRADAALYKAKNAGRNRVMFDKEED